MKWNRIWLLLTAMTTWCALYADSLSVYSPFVQSERWDLQRQLTEESILAPLQAGLAPGREYKWVTACYAMQLLEHRSVTARQALFQALSATAPQFLSLQRAALEAAYTLYPKEFAVEIKKLGDSTRDVAMFGAAALYLLRMDSRKSNRDSLIAKMQNKFKDRQDDPLLACLSHYLNESSSMDRIARGDWLTLLRHSLGGDHPIIYSIQRHNRDYPGITVVKKPDGSFLRNPDGSLFFINHLARSLSAMPGYMAHGNTPQGLYSIHSIEKSDSDYIGPSPALLLSLPCEINYCAFIHQKNCSDTSWTLEKYNRLLPGSWRNYFPIQEAYFAGRIGRCDIMAHGTALDPAWYRGKPFYPFTPSLGCLTAFEAWRPADGLLLLSDQQALVHAYQAVGGKNGYFILVEKDNVAGPVTWQEIVYDLLTAENR